MCIYIHTYIEAEWWKNSKEMAEEDVHTERERESEKHRENMA